MNRKYILLVVAAFLLVVSSCSEKKESRTVITTIDTPVENHGPKALGDTTIVNSFDWNKTYYTSRITRTSLHDVIVKDDEGSKYYDNEVTLALEGPNGEMFKRTYKKADFESYINSNYIKPSKSVLIGVAFKDVVDGNAVFVATVGSPDVMAEEFMFVQISVDKTGASSMKKMQEDED